VLTQGALSGATKTLQSSKPVKVAATKTFAGTTWDQSAVQGIQAGSSLEVMALTTNHPEKSPATKTFLILFVAPASTMNQENTVFNATLQSFKFA
jgi:hypothetical protein